MPSIGYCLIDGNSIGFAAQSASKLSAGGEPTQAIYGTIRTVRQIVATHNMLTPIVLWDGVSWRKHVFPEYKAHRDKVATTPHEKKAKAERDEYKRQKPQIARGLKLLGVPQMLSMNMEADDLAAILTKRFRANGKKVFLISGDKDWLQLVGPGVSWHDPIRDDRINGGNFAEKTGLANPRQLVELKCLVGEPGDLGPGSGVGGIGEKKARWLLETYGSVGGFLNAWIDGSLKDEKLHKAFLDFAAENSPGQEIFQRNLMLIDLRTEKRPEMLDPKLTKGAFNREGFIEFCGQFAFKSILKDIDAFLEPFDPAAREAMAA